MPQRGKLYPIVGVNLYDVFIPEMVEQLKHATNDPEYPEHTYHKEENQKHTDDNVVSLF